MSWLDDEAPDTVRDKRQWVHQLVPEALTSTFGPEGGRMDHRKPTNVKRPIPENHLGPCTSGATSPNEDRVRPRSSKGTLVPTGSLRLLLSGPEE